MEGALTANEFAQLMVAVDHGDRETMVPFGERLLAVISWTTTIRVDERCLAARQATRLGLAMGKPMLDAVLSTLVRGVYVQRDPTSTVPSPVQGYWSALGPLIDMAQELDVGSNRIAGDSMPWIPFLRRDLEATIGAFITANPIAASLAYLTVEQRSWLDDHITPGRAGLTQGFDTFRAACQHVPPHHSVAPRVLD